MGKKELKVAFLLALRSLQRGSRSSVVLTVLIIAMCFTNMVFLPGLFNGIGEGIITQIVDYEVGNVMVGAKTGEQYVTDLDATLDLINSMPGVERATPHISKGATLKYRQRILGVSVKAIKPGDEKYVSPLYSKMVAGSYLGEDDTGEVIIGKPVAGDATIKQEDEFQPSLGGVRVGDSITIEYGNGYTKDYRVKGIYFTGWTSTDNNVFITWSDMEQVEGKTLDYAEYITVKAKPGYDEKFIKNELQQYGVTGYVQTTGDLLKKASGECHAELCHHQHGLIGCRRYHHNGCTLHRHHHQDHQQPPADRDPESDRCGQGSHHAHLWSAGRHHGAPRHMLRDNPHRDPGSVPGCQSHRDSRMEGIPVADTRGLYNKLPDPLPCRGGCRLCAGMAGLTRGYPERHEGLI